MIAMATQRVASMFSLQFVHVFALLLFYTKTVVFLQRTSITHSRLYGKWYSIGSKIGENDIIIVSFKTGEIKCLKYVDMSFCPGEPNMHAFVFHTPKLLLLLSCVLLLFCFGRHPSRRRERWGGPLWIPTATIPVYWQSWKISSFP